MLILLIIFCLLCGQARAEVLQIQDKATFDVTVAKTDDELKKGLMFVKEMPALSGMLFDFRRFRGQGVSMWMKNTYIELDMLFLDCDMTIVDVYENAKPLSLERIKSSHDFCYVLEINGGEARALGISAGDKAVLGLENKAILK